MTAQHQVVLFLHLLKETARQRFIFVDRRVNLMTLARLGITREEAQSLVMGLTPEHYVRGPDQDEDYPALEVWVFGLHVTETEVYVKVQVFADPPERCVCISFHESERPMRHPFRETESPETEEEQR